MSARIHKMNPGLYLIEKDGIHYNLLHGIKKAYLTKQLKDYKDMEQKNFYKLISEKGDNLILKKYDFEKMDIYGEDELLINKKSAQFIDNLAGYAPLIDISSNFIRMIVSIIEQKYKHEESKK